VTISARVKHGASDNTILLDFVRIYAAISFMPYANPIPRDRHACLATIARYVTAFTVKHEVKIAVIGSITRSAAESKNPSLTLGRTFLHTHENRANFTRLYPSLSPLPPFFSPSDINGTRISRNRQANTRAEHASTEISSFRRRCN